MNWALYIKHKLTFYHFLYNKKNKTVLAICRCGWKRYKTPLKYKIRRPICFVIGHDWEKDIAEEGPAGFENPDYTIEMQQCNFCLKTISGDWKEYDAS